LKILSINQSFLHLIFSNLKKNNTFVGRTVACALAYMKIVLEIRFYEFWLHMTWGEIDAGVDPCDAKNSKIAYRATAIPAVHAS